MKRVYLVLLPLCLTTTLLLSQALRLSTSDASRNDTFQSRSAKHFLPPELNPPGVMPAINPGIGHEFFGVAEAAQNPNVVFSKTATYSAGGAAPSSIAVADVNGDGKADEIVLNQCSAGNSGNCIGPGVISVLLGNGNGTFQTARNYSSGGYISIQVVAADLNGDGKIDLAVLNTCLNTQCEGPTDVGSISILLGNGDGTFQPPQIVPTLYFPSSIAAGDINGDGKIDLAVSYFCDPDVDQCESGAVDVYLGSGNGTFQSPLHYNSGGYISQDVVLADLNKDGRPDLVFANCGGPNCFNGTVGVMLGNGNGTFQTPSIYGSGAVLPLTLTVGDVDGDGNLDVLVDNTCLSPFPCSEPVLSVLLGSTSGILQAAQTYNAGGYGCSNSGYCPVSLALTDINGDGKLDVVAPFNVLMGNGDGTFQAPLSYSSDSCRRGEFVVADLDGDGKPDVSIANYFARNGCSSMGLTVLLNVSALPTTTSLESSSSLVAVAQTITYTATVSSEYAGQIGGNVVFKSGTVQLGSAPLVNGQATINTSFATSGSRSVKATYSGDMNNIASVSQALKQTVNKNVSSVGIVSSQNPSTFGQAVLFTATVTASGTPTGTVTFMANGVAIGTVALNGTTASLSTTTLKSGNDGVTAVYSGDATFNKSNSTKLIQKVTPAPSSESMTSSQNPSAAGQTVTFTATVSSFAGVPTGTVIFKNGSTMLGSVALSSGIAALTTSTLPTGSNGITAHYAGATDYGTSSSSVTQVVQ